MNCTELKKIIRQNFVFYLIGFLLVFGIKYFYSKAGSDELIWILAPTTRLVTILSGIPFTYESGIGYVNHELRFIIAPSCSGVQFMMITIATLIFSYVHRMGIPRKDHRKRSFPAPNLRRKAAYFRHKSVRIPRKVYSKRQKFLSFAINIAPSHRIYRCIGWMSASIGASYLLTVLVNSMRIVLAICLPVLFQRQNLYHGFLSPEKLHTVIGTAVYFVSLLVIYRLAGDISYKIAHPCCKPQTDNSGIKKHTLIQILHKCLPPVFWYFFIVLGVPYLHGANRRNTKNFREYAVLITLVCITVLCMLSLPGLVRRQLSHRRLKNSHSDALANRLPLSEKVLPESTDECNVSALPLQNRLP